MPQTPIRQTKKTVDPAVAVAALNTPPVQDPGDFVPVAETPAETPAATITLSPEQLAAMIESAVAAKVNEIRGPDVIDPAPEPAPEPVYKKTYRCDSSPNLKVAKMDFLRAQRDGVRPQTYPIPGEYIEFKNGFFKTNDDNEIAQLEWSMSNPSVRGGLFDGQIIGGNPSIYEDDGGYIYKCDVAGCDFVTASQNAMTAHKAASHRFI